MTNEELIKKEARWSLISVSVFFIAVGLLVANVFVDKPLAVIFTLAGVVGLITFLFLVYKTGKIMERRANSDKDYVVNVNNYYTEQTDHPDKDNTHSKYYWGMNKD